MRRLILPVGLIVALLVALVAPQPGLRMAGPYIAFCLIAGMFLVNGYQTDLRSLAMNRKLAGAFVICTLVSFVGGSLLGKALVMLFDFGPEISTGIIVICTMAPTLSSVVVITREANGNVTWAILITVVLNLCAIFMIPGLLSLLLSGTSVSLPVLPLLRDLVLSILVPLLVGMGLRKIIRKPPSATINLLPTLLVILMSYMSFCAGRGAIVESRGLSLVLLSVTLLSIHLILFAIALGLSILARHDIPQRKAVVFLSSQKTLPTAIGILASLGHVAGPAALPCVLFHFMQILCDSIIAAYWRPAGQSPAKTPQLQDAID